MKSKAKAKAKVTAKKPATKVAAKKKAAPPVVRAKAATAKAKTVRKAKPAAKPAGRKLISSGSKWEPIIGYSRAVRVGNAVFVSGTTGRAPDGTLSADVYRQTRQTLQNILNAVAPEGVKAAHAVRTRIFMTDISKWEQAAKAHGEIFSDIRPACTMVEVSKLIDRDLVVEIEADFVIA